MTEMLGGNNRNRTFNALRAEVLELAVKMEPLMDSAISAAYGQSASTAQEIQAEFLGRLPIKQRIAILRRILEARELDGSFAFVVPILTRTFDVRNDLAHSLSAGYDKEKRAINLVSMRKGIEVPKSYDALYLHWLIREQAPVVERELGELYFLIAPDSRDWHEA
jgi:hypothetical protein